MSWNAARDRARDYRSRKPYKPVAPVGPDLSKLSERELQALTGPDAASFDEHACMDCGLINCNCDYLCGGCGETVARRSHDDGACWRAQRAWIVESYVMRKRQLPRHVDPYFAVSVLDGWANDARANDYGGMSEDERTWAIRWRFVSTHLRIESPKFVAKLRRYIELAQQGYSHDQIERVIHGEQAKVDRDKAEAMQRDIDAELKRHADMRTPAPPPPEFVQQGIERAAASMRYNFPVMPGISNGQCANVPADQFVQMNAIPTPPERARLSAYLAKNYGAK